MQSDITKSVLAGVPMPLILIGDDERIKLINPPAERLFGQRMQGRHVYAVLRNPEVLRAVSTGLRTGERSDLRLLRADHAQETLYRVVCAPVEANGERGILVSLEDVTPLETAGQMRRDFVANVSHELRTPLTALMGFIETLRGPARDDAAARDRFLQTMESEAGRMNRLVSDLLSLSRVESEERVRPTDTVDLRDLAESVCRSLRPLAGGTALEVSAADDLPAVRGDADQVRQVLTNLIENALKYGSDGNRVDIRIAQVARDPILGGAAVQIDVRDFGAGIDEVHVHRLTERFYRADSHRSRELGGTGLGLAIVKHIMNRHRGRLKIFSEPGQGSCFSVIFPLDAR
jgi:two-component system phosphate regulon sensor histidine kinase PhoR